MNYFGSYFIYFIYLALLTTWLNLKPSYLAQLCSCTGATHREEITKLWTILKLKFLHIFCTYWPGHICFVVLRDELTFLINAVKTFQAITV